MKSDALMRWNDKQGFVRGRKWSTLKLPRGMVLAIQAMASRRGISCNELLEKAFSGNPELAADFERTLHPWAGLVRLVQDLPGQQTLRLD